MTWERREGDALAIGTPQQRGRELQPRGPNWYQGPVHRNLPELQGGERGDSNPDRLDHNRSV